ncbi:helix-turn-helix domain-containing protein [Halalkalibacter krulwichiae]|uniref:HTH-type transcriptional regulator Xre n=1 Tax=Halalkalibacter krulwichiae TaxID=199441 RepID=A0A1X9M814_9BACI|nr:helix-turn-helix transcriptional regulator [Halalkalibacter krulwichiae]ARK28740.1 HTH-type transcriptional regulator Xre [Halalkalibacter krulwichiae]
MEFKDRLKLCRNNKKITQEKLAEKLGIKRPTYAKYETGENLPDITMLNKLADFFEVSTDYLLGRTDQTTPISFAAKDGYSKREKTDDETERLQKKFNEFLKWQKQQKND